MRVAAMLTAAFLLSGCAFAPRERVVAPAAPPPAAPVTTLVPLKPEPRLPHKPIAPRPAPPPQSINATPVAPPPTDYSSRCHAMAENRADDARQLSATPADLSKIQADTYRDCMAQSVK